MNNRQEASLVKFNALPLRIKLALGFAVGIVVSVLLSVASMVALRGLSNDLHLVVDNRVGKLTLLADIQNNASISAIAARDLVLDDTNTDRASIEARLAEARQHNTRLYAELDKLVVLPRGRALLADVVAKRKAYSDLVDALQDKVSRSHMADAKLTLQEDMPPVHAKYFQSIRALADFQHELLAADSTRANAMAGRIGWVLACGVVLAVALSALAGWLVTRSLMRELGGEPAHVARIARAVAEGELGSAIAVDAADQHSVMASMRDMQASLRGLIGQVRACADHIATGASQIATGTQDLSARTEQQAGSLQETAASLEQLTGTVAQNSDTAREADRLATDAREVAGAGGSVVAEVVSTMEDITASSRKIADIISVIDGIAFQTNILALNAAVESARAGEQGRGFAVVASEVRSLAQRSAQAAKEIKTLIGASVERIDNGSRQVSRAGATMQEIVSQVGRVSQLIGEISGATREQSGGIAQVNEAMGRLDQATQQNAALVEESAAASESLRQQADQLLQAVAAFRTEAAR